MMVVLKSKVIGELFVVFFKLCSSETSSLTNL